ncbi:metallophosphoesterase family protein [Methylocystis sp. Sn-Cys]|uniref:metallophosphoesterase family protein n=1 Tax=Methylocystis sp. Sn-Cys TaxID=1701263 RepID=UPI001920E158|nr:metallophosphoesterase family protein [Methylocystis sp. Sn-Cys]MBL1258057.1 serine/threonine protein phosphatase [Methylocystis sp. Sn-Cys]
MDETTISNAAAPDGMRIYAIGDIHGRADLLDRLAQTIDDDLRKGDYSAAVCVFLGDYVDRGLDSRGVIDRLARRDFPTPIVTLRGNHEDEMLRYLDDPAMLDQFVAFGGLTTLASYGVDAGLEMKRGGAPAVLAAFLERFPQSHRRFLEETQYSAEYGGYFFCHAGVRPHVPLERQDPGDLMWIRYEFLNYRGPFEKVIVHGHTPHARVENLVTRINLDTHAFKSGVLTAAALEGKRRRFMDTAG